MKKETKAIIVDSVKLAISLITAIGAEIICEKGAIRIIGDDDLSPVGRGCACVAGAVIGGMISEAADGYIDRTVDGVLENADRVLALVRNVKETSKGDDI